MSRVPYLTESDLPEEDREMLARPINLFRALANSPGGFRRFYELGEWIRWKCSLDPRVREMAILRVGYLTASEYEFSHHLQIGRSFGVTDEDIAAVTTFPAGGDHLSGFERAVLTAATELATDMAIRDEVWSALAEALTSEQLVELVIVIAFYCQVVRVLGALQIDNEPEYQAGLEKFPIHGPTKTAGT